MRRTPCASRCRYSCQSPVDHVHIRIAVQVVDDQFDDRVQQILPAVDVVVQRHGLDAKVGAEPAHREVAQIVLIDQGDGRQHQRAPVEGALGGGVTPGGATRPRPGRRVSPDQAAACPPCVPPTALVRSPATQRAADQRLLRRRVASALTCIIGTQLFSGRPKAVGGQLATTGPTLQVRKIFGFARLSWIGPGHLPKRDRKALSRPPRGCDNRPPPVHSCSRICKCSVALLYSRHDRRSAPVRRTARLGARQPFTLTNPGKGPAMSTPVKPAPSGDSADVGPTEPATVPPETTERGPTAVPDERNSLRGNGNGSAASRSEPPFSAG